MAIRVTSEYIINIQTFAFLLVSGLRAVAGSTADRIYISIALSKAGVNDFHFQSKT